MMDRLDALEARISNVEAHQQILNLQARYSFLIDTNHVEQAVELFTEDFVWEAGTDRKVRISTKSELLEFLARSDAGNVMTRHQVLTPDIEINGDSATGSWYLFGPGTGIADGREVANWTHGRYDNEYRREDGTWKISLLSFTFDFRSPYEDGWVTTPIMREDWLRR